MSFGPLINAATKYSEYLDIEQKERDFRSSVKDNFMNCYCGATANKTAEQIAVLNQQIEKDFPKAAKKAKDWTKKKLSTEQQMDRSDAEVLKSAQAFHTGCMTMREDPRYIEYRAARKTLKDAVKKLGKEGISKESINEQLDKSGLSSVKFKAEQLYKYSKQ